MRIFKINFIVCLLFTLTLGQPALAENIIPTLDSKKIVITQIISHPSLDLIVKGVIAELKENGCQDENITLENAQGNIATAVQIAHKIASSHPDVVIAIATPSAQTVQKAVHGLQIPMVFGAVTDPIGAKVVKSLEETGPYITGTIDLPSAEEQVKLMERLMPSLKRLGLIYNPSESNTVYQLKLLKEILAQRNIDVVEIAVSKTSDVQSAAASLLDKVQAIFVPNDNTIVAAIQPLLKVAEQAKIPVFVSDPESVQKGALAAVANDQYEVGRATGQMAVQILTGVSPSSLSVEAVKSSKIYINQKVKRKLGL